MLSFILGSQSRVSVLRVLCHEDDLSGRQVANRAGLPSSSAKLALDELLAAGVISCTVHGARHGYQLNPEHHLLRPLRRLFVEESRTFSRLAALVYRYLEHHGVHRELLALGLSRAGVLTIALADAVDLFGPHHKTALGEEIHSGFGLSLGPPVEDPTAIPTAERVWPDPGSDNHEALTVSRLVDFLNPTSSPPPGPEKVEIP